MEANTRVQEAGLEGRVSFVFCDYREVLNHFGVGCFDAVVSCEMIEAVGHEHLPTYFDIISQAVKPGGYFAMQVCQLLFDLWYCESMFVIKAGLMAFRSSACQMHAMKHIVRLLTS